MDTNTTTERGRIDTRRAIDACVGAARARRSHYLGTLLRGAWARLADGAPDLRPVTPVRPVGA